MTDTPNTRTDLNTLETYVWDLWQRTAPPPSTLNDRTLLIARLQAIITKRYGEQYTVTSFGSTAYGISSVTSDLDLAVIDGFRPDGFGPDVTMEDLPPIYNPNNLARTLANHGMLDVQPIRANVPIVKFTDGYTKIQCDININEQFGIRNSRLLKAYLDLTPIGRPLSLAIKTWARQRGLNDPSGSDGPTTLSSYSLTLLLLAYLQHTGHLPNLQDPDLISSTNVEASHLWMRPTAPRVNRHKRRKEKNAPTKQTAGVEPKHGVPPAPQDVIISNSDSINALQTTNIVSSIPIDPSHPPPQTGESITELHTTQGPPPIERVRCDTTFVPSMPNNTGWVQKQLALGLALADFFAYYSGEFIAESHMVDIARGGIVLRDVPFFEPPPLVKAKKPRKRREKAGKASKEDKNGGVISQPTEIKDEHVPHVESTTIGVSRTVDQPSKTPVDGDDKDEDSTYDKDELVVTQMEDIDNEGSTSDPNSRDQQESVSPDKWSEHLLVTQDPFIRARNTSQNIRPTTARGILEEFKRAHHLIQSGVPFDVVCEKREGPAVGEIQLHRKTRALNPTHRPTAKKTQTPSNNSRPLTGESERSITGNTRRPKVSNSVQSMQPQRSHDGALDCTNYPEPLVTRDAPLNVTTIHTSPFMPTPPIRVPPLELPPPTTQQLLQALQKRAATRGAQRNSVAGHDDTSYPPSQTVRESEPSARYVVKGIRTVPEALLRRELEQFGSLNKLDISEDHRLAFLEFKDAVVAQRAIDAASSEGGIWINIDNDARVLVRIEPSKPRKYPRNTRRQSKAHSNKEEL